MKSSRANCRDRSTATSRTPGPFSPLPAPRRCAYGPSGCCCRSSSTNCDVEALTLQNLRRVELLGEEVIGAGDDHRLGIAHVTETVPRRRGAGGRRQLWQL